MNTRDRRRSTPVYWPQRKLSNIYEMSRYGTLRTWANELGLAKAAALFEKTLKEEKATDDALTQIADSVVTQEAQQAAE
jgi:ferritin-like metal-binding protein YciE